MLNTNYSEKFVKEGLTYDDVLLIPAESHVLPNEVDLSTNLTAKIRLNTPIMTSRRKSPTITATPAARPCTPTPRPAIPWPMTGS